MFHGGGRGAKRHFGEVSPQAHAHACIPPPLSTRTMHHIQGGPWNTQRSVYSKARASRHSPNSCTKFQSWRSICPPWAADTTARRRCHWLINAFVNETQWKFLPFNSYHSCKLFDCALLPLYCKGLKYWAVSIVFVDVFCLCRFYDIETARLVHIQRLFSVIGLYILEINEIDNHLELIFMFFCCIY